METSTPQKGLRFAFFGTPEFAVIVLDELEATGYLPSLVVTAPDRPRGRKLVVTPSEVKVWASTHNIPCLTPEKLRDEAFLEELKKADCTLFIVAVYGKLIPKLALDMPIHGTLNVHPSLLPKFRGPSPVASAILSEETRTGVTIMLLDEEMDHGPIVSAREVTPRVWPPKGSELTNELAHVGGKLLAETLPHWLEAKESTPQEHAQATFTKKMTKEDGLIELSGDPALNYKKIRAFDERPGAYFYAKRGDTMIRVRILDALLEGGTLKLTRVIPEGKKEMPYEDFLRGMQ